MSCSCSSETKSDLPFEIAEKVNNHPCYSEGAHHHYARIHLAVAPACNIQCNYCNRKYDCSNESRPGVTSEKLKPMDAVKKVLHVGSEIKQLSVIGIAGPGDALANPKKTFETFELINKYAPDQKLCISTNGLSLPLYVDKLYELGVDHVTVTINTIDPEIGAEIYPWVYDTVTKKRYTGVEGAKLLLERQLEGIQKCIEKGILIKANSVLIPNINDKDLVNVSKKLKEMGVFLHNIMPLLSKPEFGTKFGLDGVPSATNEELLEVQEECGMDMKLMKHCRQCRADAVGLIGEDRSDEFTKERTDKHTLEELATMYNVEGRREAHQKIEEFRVILAEANERVKREEADQMVQKIKVAVTSFGEGMVNEHFGNAKEFLIYESNGNEVTFLQHRKIENPYCNGNETCGASPIEEIKEQLKDVDLLLTAKIGECPQKELKKINLTTNDTYAFEPIDSSILKATREFLSFDEEMEVN